VLLVIIAVVIGVQVQALLIGQSVEPDQRVRMLDFLQKCDEIDKVFNLLTLQLGNDVMVALKRAFPQVLWSFFEPDPED